MKNLDIVHCSDECLTDLIKDSDSVVKDEVSEKLKGKKSDP